MIALGQLVFAPGLAVMVWASYRKEKRLAPLATSIPTAAVLWIYVGVYLTMGAGFIYAAITTGATALMWSLLILRWQKKPTPPRPFLPLIK